jgi:hypothetical protein
VRLLPLGVALACFGLYVALAVPGVYWLDSSEFAAAAWTLGIAHPPGHPLMELWSRCFTLLPLGSIGFRVAIGQAAAAALAAGALCVLARDVLRKLGAGELAAALLGAAAAIIFALSYGLAFHAVRPEVYALSAATTLGAAACALRGTRRGFAAAALLVGLGLANHHLLAIAGAAPILGLAIAERDLGARGWALLLAAGALALGCYLYIPLRALRAPLVDWGHATTASQFWWLVSARAFQKAVHRAADVPLAFEAMRELGIGAAVCALGGLAALLRTRATRRIAVFLLAQIVCFTAVSALAGFDAANPDSHGYLAGAMAFAAVLTVAFPAAILLTLRDRAPRVAAFAAGVVALACVLAQGVRGFGRYSLADTYGADRVLTQVLADPPPRAVLTSNYFQTVFGLWYEQAIEGARPDVAIFHPRFASNAPPADASRRPALYELGPGTPQPRLDAAGLFYREGSPLEADFAAQDALWDRLAAQADDPLTRDYLVWQIYLGAELRCHLGLRPAADRALDRATMLGAGETPEVAALRAHCQP